VWTASTVLAEIARVRVLVFLALGACAVDPTGDEDVRGHGELPVAGVLPPTTASIADVVAWLDGEMTMRSPGSDLSITVEDLQTGERVSLHGDTKHVSASSAKAWWVAAALDGVGPDDVGCNAHDCLEPCSSCRIVIGLEPAPAD
jgi:D-alanyl-D-alanine carboxypeptidase